MPSLTLPECGRYIPPPETKEDLEWADLAIVDLSKANTPEGRAELYPQLRDALRTHGFVYAINHGYTQAQRDRIFDIADVPFADVSPDEKKTYTVDAEKVGYYAGYKPRQLWKLDTESKVLDQVEHYAINMKVEKRPHPQVLRQFLPELDAFARHNHFNILHPILRLIALSLELPEETLVKKHNLDRTGETSVRFMKYYRRSKDEEEKSKNVWLKGHTDIGSITILWSQPIGGLQIQAPDGRWKWVRHIDNALVINTGDMMTFLTGGYYKPTIHRVVQPPEDQRSYDRLGVYYFAMPDNDVRLLPCIESPVLQRVGIERQCPDEDAPLCDTWRKGRTTTYGRTDLKKGVEKNVEEEVIEGIVVKHYN
ncbi:Clavaminate synthase-like protein [Rhizopogon vinicolor AM-OR11-026]|uniref:Clavaminate synthase-like protein n=1 Tax=Rhizopogon vinicolor AM-OR11-026 TaxID=1314800 RepID=A0A1B7NCQ5_9AGAM|nr:Clavaminate synthase-like protein [Rhizopogon vinicolor AM-OR11-026]